MDIEALNLLIWELVFLVAELALYMLIKGANLLKKDASKKTIETKPLIKDTGGTSSTTPPAFKLDVKPNGLQPIEGIKTIF